MASDNSVPGHPESQPQFDLIPAHATLNPFDGEAWAHSPLAGPAGPGTRPELPRYLHALRRRWLMAVIIALPISASAVYVFWSFVPRAYTATAILRLTPNETKFVFSTADANVANANAFEAYKRTQRQLIRSRFVVIPALRDEAVSVLPIIRQEPDPVDWLENNLNVTFPDESELMYVSLSAANPAGLDQIVNALVNAYLEEFVFAEGARKHERLSSLDVAYTKVELELKRKRAELQDFEEKFGVSAAAPLTPGQQKASQQYDEIQRQIVRAQSELVQARSELEMYEATVGADNEDIEISEYDLREAMKKSPKASDLEASKQRIVDHLAATRRRLKPGVAQPRLEQSEKDLEGINQQLQTLEQALRPEIIAHKRHIAATEIVALKQKIGQLAARAKHFDEKARELETDRRLRRPPNEAESLHAQIGQSEEILKILGAERERTKVELEAELERTKGGLDADSRASASRVKHLSRAQPARITNAKARLTRAVATGVAAFLLPVLFVVWLEVRRDCINTREEVVRGLGLSVIGAVPQIPGGIMRRLDRASKKQQYWRTLLSESIDSIAAVLLHGTKGGAIRTVMVSSATSGEGKTTLAANLATSLAGAGRRTVLVDFDLRRPALHRLFQLNLQPGIGEVLRGRTELEASLQLTQIPNLEFLAAGRWSATGLAGLASADLESLIHRLRNGFEFVVVDGSPVIPVIDTRLIARHVDAVMISVLRDTSRIPQVRAACELLQKFSVPILGVVITGSRSDAYPDSAYAKYPEPKAV
jgi:capsular exopolysaccharide synthesis family protein